MTALALRIAYLEGMQTNTPSHETYALNHDTPATRLSGQPTPNRLRAWDTEHEQVILPAGTRFDLVTDPRSVGPPATLLLLTTDGWYRADASNVARTPWTTEFRDVYAEASRA